MADAVVAIHALFVAFVAIGGLLTLRWPRVAWLHIPAALWGAFIELTGRICPLTPLENRLREQAGQTGYEGDFIAHYVVPILYPTGLTYRIQIALGVAVLALNAAIYTWLWRRRTPNMDPEPRTLNRTLNTNQEPGIGTRNDSASS